MPCLGPGAAAQLPHKAFQAESDMTFPPVLRPVSRVVAIFCLGAGLSLPQAPALADEITDLLLSAIDAYQDGDVQYALDEIEMAKQELMALKTDALGRYLPPAPDGWTREVSSDVQQGLAMLGGGVGAEASYQGDGKSYTIKLMADNPMVTSLAGIINNASMMGLKSKRVNRQKFVIQDGEIMGLVANRILVQVSGADIDTMLGALEAMDFEAMGRFGS